ncbi:TetR/AcrR family transcriptional regulator [Rhizobium jaguaris]|uniref:TetR/AcrR family transcriptional regulator n=1 Tax=Rhizobium jaguaris TaxID=1312183 RepID=A0A387G1K7_9HYPH|nr:TetR/AcrR family transcriptional regulator [Rhizobium jaguaris]AYG64418.1 TetR/AcrR family transcriptional regulator [Rhizobium jaguaris]
MDTFWRNGYEGTSAQNLVDATGLGRGSLYAAFSNKDGLFEQALLRYRKCSQAHVDQLRQDGSPVGRLREMMMNMINADMEASSEKRGCLATNSAIEMAGRDPRVAGLVRENFTILMQGIEETIRRSQAAGEVRPEVDTASLALFVFNAVQGLRVLAKSARPQDRKKLITIIDQTLAVMT